VLPALFGDVVDGDTSKNDVKRRLASPRLNTATGMKASRAVRASDVCRGYRPAIPHPTVLFWRGKGGEATSRLKRGKGCHNHHNITFDWLVSCCG